MWQFNMLSDMHYDINHIRKLTQQRQLTYKELASLVGWNESKVKRLFSGRARLTVHDQNTLLTVLLDPQPEPAQPQINTLFNKLNGRDQALVLSLMKWLNKN